MKLTWNEINYNFGNYLQHNHHYPAPAPDVILRWDYSQDSLKMTNYHHLFRTPAQMRHVSTIPPLPGVSSTVQSSKWGRMSSSRWILVSHPWCQDSSLRDLRRASMESSTWDTSVSEWRSVWIRKIGRIAAARMGPRPTSMQMTRITRSTAWGRIPSPMSSWPDTSGSVSAQASDGLVTMISVSGKYHINIYTSCKQNNKI